MHLKLRLNNLMRRITDSALLFWIAWLAIVNRYSRRRIATGTGPVVSLTSYGKRLRTVHFTIESIAQGNILPSKIILWVDEKKAYDQPPATLCRLQARGLEIRLCNNYGPHTKYYPYVETAESFDVPMVIADDDILYPRWWLKKLFESFKEHPDAVNCFLAKAVAVDDAGIARYGAWKIATSTNPSACNVAHGVNGAIFPSQFLKVLKSAGNGFQSCCPKADDIWLHAQALRAGFKVRQVCRRAARFSAIPGTQADGLWIQNNAEGNDQAIKATYTPADAAILLASNAELPGRGGGGDLSVRWAEKIREKCERLILLRFWLLGLLARNIFSKAGITAPNGPVVSLTTYGQRVKRVHLSIESIAAGTLLPSRLILWLDEAKVFENPPPALIRLRRRGLELKLTEKFGPHCKYYPYVVSEQCHSIPLVTADDDIVYPKWWLQQLVRAYDQYPMHVNCFRARAVMIDDNGSLGSYQQWSLCRTTEAKYSHLLTGVSGVIYPPKLLDSLRSAGAGFMQRSPKADDLWLHAKAIRAGFKVRQLYSRPMHFPVVPGTEELSLQALNVVAGKNDLQASATYLETDIAQMRRDCSKSQTERISAYSDDSSGRQAAVDIVPFRILFVGLTE